jgi:diaminohydroxyphosphoribosylaminopyrimidine deaminase/5-amino-6-(5-phosphoribosylamino)uracil reductase
MLEELGRREINELHVEAGFHLNGSLLAEGCVDELLIYLAPSVIGGGGRGMFNLPDISDLSEQRRLSIARIDQIGDDVRIIARVVK